MNSKFLHFAGLLAGLLFICPACQVRAGLPPEAQAAIKQGILAAKGQEWELAIQSFQEARKTAPTAPEVYYNLGLAESKLPGRELRSIAWLGAYLATTNAPNTAAVKDFIAELQIKYGGTINRLLKTVQDAVPQTGAQREENLGRVAELWAKAGDVSEAIKTADLIQNDLIKSYAYSSIAEVQAKRGDVAGAQKTAAQIQNLALQGAALGIVVGIQLEGGDIKGAQKTIELFQEPKNLSPEGISGAQGKPVDNGVAQKIADLARVNKGEAQADIALAQAQAGDSTSARITVASAQKTVDLVQDEDAKSPAQSAIVEAQAESGDLAGAKMTASLIKQPYYQGEAQIWIAATPGAVGRIRTVPPTTKVSDWIHNLDAGIKSPYCPLNTDIFLDLAGYLKTLPSSDNPQTIFEKLRDTAGIIINAHYYIDQMFKQQAGQQAQP